MENNRNTLNSKSTCEKKENKQAKLEFFWEHCAPEVQADVADAIREKTFRKIQEKKTIQPSFPRSPRRKSSLRAIITLTSVAASVAILFVFIQLTGKVRHQEDIREFAAKLDLLPEEETEEVTLILSEEEKHELESDVQIAYAPDGNVSINTHELLSAKEETTENPIQEEISQEEVIKEKTSEPTAYNQLIVPKGKRSQLVLSEGTKVWVNAGTKLIYPRVFSKDKREIYVDGEIYIEVSPDAARPFYVNTNGFEIKVLGTAFDVYAYKQMAVSKIALVKGSVQIKDRNERQMQMSPDELVVLEQNNIVEKKSVCAADYKAWTEGIMILNGEHLPQLAKQLSLFYGKDIVCDPSLSNEQIYGKLDLRDNLEDILDFIRSMIPLSVSEESGVIYLKREK